MLMLYNYIFCKLKQHGVLVGNSTFHTSLLLLQLNQSSLSSKSEFLCLLLSFFSSVSAPQFFVAYSQAILLLRDGCVDGDGGNLVASSSNKQN